MFLRLCFVSFDPDLYLNEDAEVFMTQSYPNNETKSQKDLDWVWDFTSIKKNFQKGRNNFIHLFACNANRFDFEMNDVITMRIYTVTTHSLKMRYKEQ